MGVRRGPVPKISLDRIVDAAVGIARSEGLPRVTVSSVADEVGCAKMALYRHISNRGDLLAAMIDRALGPAPRLDGTEQENVIVLWDSLLEVYERDPWLLALPAETNALTPHNLEWIDAALGVLEGCGVPRHERLEMVLLITENARFAARRHHSSRGTTSDLDALMASAAEASPRLPAERFPHLAAQVESGSGTSPRHHDWRALARDHVVRSLAAYDTGRA